MIVSSIGWWIEWAARRARLVVSAAAIIAAVAGAYAATHLRMETDTNALLSSDLPYRKTQESFDKAFPQLGDNIVIVIDGKTPERAEEGARALATRLRAHGGLFEQVFFPAGDPFFRKNGLLFLSTGELQTLSDRLADTQPLLATLAKDMSLRGLFDLLSQGSEAVVDGTTDAEQLVEAFKRIGDAVEAYAKNGSAELNWRELMQPTPLSPSDYRQFILVQPHPDYSSLAPAESAIAMVRADIAGEGLTEARGVRVRLTGGIPIREDEIKSVTDGVGLASVISFVIVTAVVFIGLRSLRLVLAIVLCLVMGLMWTVGFAALAIGHLNLLSVSFAVMFIGIAVDFGIQMGLRYKENASWGLSHGAALVQSAETGAAVCLAALCAVIGFLAFVPTAYVGLAELGVISGAGMLIGAVFALTVLPALLTLMPPRAEIRHDGRAPSTSARGRFIVRHCRAICLGALVLGSASLAALPWVRFDFDPIALDDPNAESVQTYIDLAQNGSTSPYSINVVATDLGAADSLARRINPLAVVDSTITLQSFIPNEQAEKLDIIRSTAMFMQPVLVPGQASDRPTFADYSQSADKFAAQVQILIASPEAGPLAEPARRLADLVGRFIDGAQAPQKIAGLETALLAGLPYQLDSLRDGMAAGPVTLESLPADLRDRYMAADGRARVEVFPKENLTDRNALRRFVDTVRNVAPDATDTPVILLMGGDAIMSAFAVAGALAVGAISILLLVVLRSFVYSALVLLPLILALALSVAVMTLSGMSFNFANVIALPLLLTLGVAFGIYLVFRYREIGNVADLLRTSTPRAVLFSALTTMVSFGSLMVSSHRGTASMGLLLTICLTLAMACTLIVLPALLAWRERWRQSRAPLAHDIGVSR